MELTCCSSRRQSSVLCCRMRLSMLLDKSRLEEMRLDRMPDSRSTMELLSRALDEDAPAAAAASVPATFEESDDGSSPTVPVRYVELQSRSRNDASWYSDASVKPELEVYDTPRKYELSFSTGCCSRMLVSRSSIMPGAIAGSAGDTPAPTCCAADSSPCSVSEL